MALHHKIKMLFKRLAGRRAVSFFDFDMYAPYSRGPNRQKTDHAIDSTNQIFPRLAEFASSQGNQALQLIPAEIWGADTRDIAIALKPLLDNYGSDKANKHNYHFVLGRILKERSNLRAILEIGLGSNDPKVVSNMTARGKPGASVRAFRDFLPAAQVFGADFDRGALFTEDRIKTYFVDQTDPATLVELGKFLPEELDLIIDDGLHSPLANLNSLRFGLGRLRRGGWMVIEDVNPLAEPFWQTVAGLLSSEFEAHWVQCTRNPVFLVQRLAP